MNRPRRGLLGGALTVLWSCSSTSPEVQGTVVRSTQDLSLRMAEAPGFLRNELGRLGEVPRTFQQLFVPDPARVRLITSPLVSAAVTAEPQRMATARRTLSQLSDLERAGAMHRSVTGLASRSAGATSLSLAIELQRTSDAVRTAGQLLRRSQDAFRRIDLVGSWPDSPLHQWLAILLK